MIQIWFMKCHCSSPKLGFNSVSGGRANEEYQDSSRSQRCILEVALWNISSEMQPENMCTHTYTCSFLKFAW